jgi:asparagine synthase (glutamine-hydrolysing)
LETRRADGVALADLADHFSTFDNARRWCGGALRRRADQVDYFQPLCSRPWIETAFSIRALTRYCEPVHYELLRQLDPRLHAMPFVGHQWRPQAPLLAAADAAAQSLRRRIGRRARSTTAMDSSTEKVFAKHRWLEDVIDELREVCLGVSDPVFWDIVDRQRLEHLLSPATAAETRKQHSTGLLAIATAAYYSAATS